MAGGADARPCLLTGKRAFEEPISLPDGRALPTLLDAGEYINSLSKAEQRTTEWQTRLRSCC